MRDRKGFTLIELIVVMIIIGILVCIAIPIYSTMTQQGTANAAEHNVIAIYNAQQLYYFNNNSNYCLNNCADQLQTVCANNMDSINCALSLNITDSIYAYSCYELAGMYCKAYNTENYAISVNLTKPIVLTGAANCATSTDAGCNPRCTTITNAPCPNS